MICLMCQIFDLRYIDQARPPVLSRVVSTLPKRTMRSTAFRSSSFTLCCYPATLRLYVCSTACLLETCLSWNQKMTMKKMITLLQKDHICPPPQKQRCGFRAGERSLPVSQHYGLRVATCVRYECNHFNPNEPEPIRSDPINYWISIVSALQCNHSVEYLVNSTGAGRK